MKLFVRKEHPELFKEIRHDLRVGFMILAILGAFVANGSSAYISTFFWVIMIVVLGEFSLVAVDKLFIEKGLYIDGDSLCLKVFRKKHYDIHDVAGLLILKSQCQNYFVRHISWRFFEKSDGEDCCSIVYLSEICQGFENYSGGNMEFSFKFGKNVLFYTIYDEDVVKYFESKNIPVFYGQNK